MCRAFDRFLPYKLNFINFTVGWIGYGLDVSYSPGPLLLSLYLWCTNHKHIQHEFKFLLKGPRRGALCLRGVHSHPRAFTIVNECCKCGHERTLTVSPDYSCRDRCQLATGLVSCNENGILISSSSRMTA